MRKSKLSRRITWRVILIMFIFNVFIIGAVFLFDMAVSLVESEERAQHVIDVVDSKLTNMQSGVDSTDLDLSRIELTIANEEQRVKRLSFLEEDEDETDDEESDFFIQILDSMAVSRTLFRNIAAHTAEPSHIVETMNKAISDSNDNNMFVTLFVGVLDLPTGHLCYCNAAHNAPYIISEKGIVKSEKYAAAIPVNPNLPVGVMADWNFIEQETELTSGSMLFLYTDGLTEAENIRHEQFGEQRVTDVVTAFKGSPQKMIETMTDAVHLFVGDTEQSDDLTMLAIKYSPG